MRLILIALIILSVFQCGKSLSTGTPVPDGYPIDATKSDYCGLSLKGVIMGKDMNAPIFTFTYSGWKTLSDNVRQGLFIASPINAVFQLPSLAPGTYILKNDNRKLFFQYRISNKTIFSSFNSDVGVGVTIETNDKYLWATFSGELVEAETKINALISSGKLACVK